MLIFISSLNYLAGTVARDKDYAVKDETESSITIQAGKKTLTFKTMHEEADISGTIIEERDIEAQKIAKKTAELNALFVDVGKLVEEQGGMIEEVGNNVDTAEELTKEQPNEIQISVLTDAISQAREEVPELERYRHQLEMFRQEQLARAETVGDRAEELLAMVECSVRHHLEAGTVLQGRELPSVMAAGCKALEGAMNIEATALGVAGLLEDFSI